MAPPSVAENATTPDRGVSSVLGFALLIGIILVSVIGIATLGSAALGDTQRQSELNRAEHTMTLLDSRTAMVALGTSDSQSIAFGQDTGSFELRPDAGQLTIVHRNYSGTETETVFNDTLGAFAYTNGDTEIAYQGGGVWRTNDEGAAQMLSPPEFHYRAATLTLPIIRVTGTPSTASSPRARISSASETQKVYPNRSTGPSADPGAPYDATSQPYENPIENGTVEVQIQSEYYEGWARYFRQRTTGDLEVFDANQTVHLTLEGLQGEPGDFNVPMEGNGLEVSGFGEGHPLDDFTLSLQSDGHFNNGHWSLYSTDGGNEFEMHIWSKDKCTGGSYDGEISFSVYFDNGTETREWQNPGINPGTDEAFQVDCDAGTMTVDFVSNQTSLTYENIGVSGSNNKWCFGEHINDRSGPATVTLDHHTVDNDTTYDRGTDTDTMEFVVNHYMSRMPTEFDLKVTDGPGASECQSTGNSGQGSSRIDESASLGRLTYDESASARFITYLHVTENPVNITLP